MGDDDGRERWNDEIVGDVLSQLMLEPETTSLDLTIGYQGLLAHLKLGVPCRLPSFSLKGI